MALVGGGGVALALVLARAALVQAYEKHVRGVHFRADDVGAGGGYPKPT